MLPTKTKYVLLLAIILFNSCHSKVDYKKESNKIKAQIDLVAKAHYNKDAALFYKPNAEKWYDIRSGKINLETKKDRIASTQNYLNAMEFKEMLMREEPIIEISDDGTLATYSNSATIRGVLDGTPIFWVVAWQNVLRKIDNEWKIISSANTEADNATSAAVILNAARKRINIANDSISIYAFAECTGPNRPFKTLVLSRKTDGRMEQGHSEGHYILKHGTGTNTSCSNDLKSKTLKDSLSPSTKAFIKGHELHWLSMWPEHRYKNATYQGIKSFNGQEAFHLAFKDDSNRPVNFYFSFEDYLPLGFDISPEGIDGKVDVYFENWNDVENISMLKDATFKQGEDLFKYQFTDIRLNTLTNEDFENQTGLIELN